MTDPEGIWLVIFGSLLAVGLFGLLVHLRSRRAHRPAPSSPSQQIVSSPAPLAVQSSSAPVVEVGPATLMPEAELDELPFDDGMASTVRSIIEQSPALAVAGAQLHSQAFKLVFSPELQRGLAEGTLAILPSREFPNGVRALVVNKQTDLIVGHGTLVQNPAVIAAGVFQILAVITAQKFLADINKSLKRLEQGIGEIKSFLEAEVFGELEAITNTLLSVAKALDRHRFEPTEITLFSREIQTAERTARIKMGQYRQLLADSIASFERQRLRGFRLRKSTGEAAHKLTEIAGRSAVYAFAARVRVLAASLRAALGLQQGHALDLLEELASELERHFHDQTTWNERARAKTPSLYSRLRTTASIQQQQRRYLETVDETFTGLQNQLQDSTDAIQRTKRRIATQLLEETRPLELRVQFNDRGQIAKLLRVVPRLEDASTGEQIVAEEPRRS